MVKKILLQIIICVVLILAFTGISMGRTEDASLQQGIISADELAPGHIPDWSQAYARYLENGSEYYSFAGNSEVTYALIYVDNNDIPEMLINTGYEASGELVVTYYNGQIVEQYLSRIGTTYAERSGYLYTDTGHMDYYPVEITKLENGVFSLVASGIRYVSQEDYARMQADPNYPYTLTCEWEGIAVTEEEFNSHIAEYYDIEQGKRPDSFYTYDEFLYLLKNGKWFSYDHSYELIKMDCTWEEAQNICREKGGYLATITCKDEASVIASLIKQQGLTDISFYVGYRCSEWIGDSFYSYRWINGDGSYTEVMPSMYSFWDYDAPDYDYEYTEWSFENDEQDCGLAKYYPENEMIYIFEAPDNLLQISPEYQGKMGFICETDIAASGDTSLQAPCGEMPQAAHRYEYYVEDCTWTQAFQKAQEKGGYLAHIDSREEFDSIISEITQKGLAYTRFMLGGRRDIDSTSYYWVDESDCTYGLALNSPEYWAYSAWMQGEPSIVDGDIPETCMCMFYSSDYGSWVFNDVPEDILGVVPDFSGKIGYIVEFDS